MEKTIHNLAPIVLFAYNRPDHTFRTLNALKQNKLSSESTLIIYCDGVPTNSTKENINNIHSIRQLVRSQKWCGSVEIIERERNYGLAENIKSGINRTFEKYSNIIVLEDDIITSEGFLIYMNQALKLYEDDEKVMHITGYMFPFQTQEEPETFFSNLPSSWGWATWRKSWEQFIDDPEYIWEQLSYNQDFERFNFGGYANFSNQLKKNIDGTIKTWAVLWYGTLFLRKGLSLYPKVSLVKNIGHDSTGINSNTTNYFNSKKIRDMIKVEKIQLVEDTIIRNSLSSFFFKQKYIKNLIIKIIKPILSKEFKKNPFFS